MNSNPHRHSEGAAILQEQTQPASPDDTTPEAPGGKRPRVAGLRDRGNATATRVKSGVVGEYWSHLSAVDFMNSSMSFAALALLCGLPLFTVLAELRGHDVARGIVTRMGLNAQAADDVRKLIAPTHASISTLGVFGAAFLILGGIGLAATLQQWYQKVYDQPPLKGVLKTLAHQFGWVLGLVVGVWVIVGIGEYVRPGGHPGFGMVLQFVFSVVFWWWSVHFLLRGRLGWRQIFPTAVATGFCLTGLAVFSALLFSGSITSGMKSYGPIGVVTALMSYFIGLGVCIHLGAVFGRMWVDRHAPASSNDKLQMEETGHRQIPRSSTPSTNGKRV
jgi:membrane protein